MRLYLDACCLNRPFDDPAIDRNRLEAEAVLVILRHVDRGEWTMVSSQALEAEINANPDPDKRASVKGFLSLQTEYIRPDDGEFTRGKEIADYGLKPMDALHVACAEASQCDVFLTTDDIMLRRLQRCAPQLRVAVANPLDWILEQMAYGGDRNDA